MVECTVTVDVIATDEESAIEQARDKVSVALPYAIDDANLTRTESNWDDWTVSGTVTVNDEAIIEEVDADAVLEATKSLGILNGSIDSKSGGVVRIDSFEIVEARYGTSDDGLRQAVMGNLSVEPLDVQILTEPMDVGADPTGKSVSRETGRYKMDVCIVFDASTVASKLPTGALKSVVEHDGEDVTVELA